MNRCAGFAGLSTVIEAWSKENDAEVMTSLGKVLDKLGSENRLEALVAEHALQPDNAYLAAAEDAVARL